MSEIVVTGVGALTPVGASAAQTCASLRAGLTGLARHPDYIAILPEPVLEAPDTIACGFALEGAPTVRDERLLQLAMAAFRDLVRGSRLSRAELEVTQLALCFGGAPRVQWPAGSEQGLARELLRRLGVTLAHPVRLLQGTAPAVFEMAREAKHLLTQREAERILILAVDCWIDEASLSWLDRNDRLQSARNPDGFLPGEAAACFLLEPAQGAQRRKAQALATLVDVGSGREKNTILTELNSTGEGLCAALRAAAKPWSAAPVGWAIGDMNGESYWGYEWGLAKVRMAQTLGATELWHPADSTGGIGVAAPALAVVLASTALARGYAPASRVLLWCGSDDEARAACALAAASPARNGGG